MNIPDQIRHKLYDDISYICDIQEGHALYSRTIEALVDYIMEIDVTRGIEVKNKAGQYGIKERKDKG